MNATALMTLDQVRVAADALAGGPPAVISVFAGRIADAGVEPVPLMTAAKQILDEHANLELLWASPREVLNVVQADEAGCDIITLTPDLLSKLALARPRPRRLLARHGEDVPRRRRRREVHLLVRLVLLVPASQFLPRSRTSQASTGASRRAPKFIVKSRRPGLPLKLA